VDLVLNVCSLFASFLFIGLVSSSNSQLASADRRPVDPPPIVELRVFEGANAENDITMTYRANFFLFATLDNARHIQHGRVPQQAQSLPVLTGTPVAGMAYLERPKPAGYFIFPDLSVRHEGKYRLGFSLYEELRDVDDMDSETAENAEKQKNPHVSHRLEVKSVPFTVFSAKRFPGLSESTQLSRVFAEQGCRVRIRRDVRMRRRGTDGKGGRDYDDYDDDHSYDRGRVSATPDRYPQPIGTPHTTPVDHADRPRSSSHSSASYMHARRPSNEQLAQQYQQPYSPQTPQGMYHPQTNGWSSQPQNGYMAPPQYGHHQGYQPPPQTSMAPPSYSGYNGPQAYAHDQTHARSNSIEYPQPPSGPPRSVSTPQPQPSVHAPYPPHSATFPPTTYGQQPAHPPAPVQPTYNSAQPHVTSPASYAAPTSLPKIEATYAQAPHQPAPVEPSLPVYQNGYHEQPHQQAGSKRAYSTSFDTQAIEQPLRQGARPSAVSIEPRYNYNSVDGGADEDSMDESAMSYRRADGTQRRMRLPHPAM
jgi:velvet factor protein